MTTPSIVDIFGLSDPQRDAALARGRDVAVTAGAGTGKTRTLVARFLALLDDGLPLRSIVAVTFTRKAAREMRNRVRAEIAEYLAGAGHDEAAGWGDLYNELDAARIGTIHNLCSEILRTHPAEAGIDPRFDVLDETQGVLLVSDAAEAALGWAAGQDEMAPLFALLNEMELVALIETLLKQRSAVAALVDAVPAETIRAHWAERLAVMQAEALDRLLADPAWRAAQATLHTLRPLDPDDKLAAQVVLVRTTVDGLAEASTAERRRDLAVVNEIDLRVGSVKAWPNRAEDKEAAKAALKQLREMYRDEKLLAAELNSLDEAAAAAMPALYALFAQATAVYEARKTERGALDFDDLEAGAIDLLAGHPDVAAYWQGQIGALLVDEFQDTNASQRRLVRLLCPDPGKLFIVGDVKQSIYRFRGADVTVFSAEKQQIAEQDGRLLDLDVSYRAHAALLAGLNRLLGPVLGEADPLRPWLAPFAPLRPGRDAVSDGLRAPFIRLQLSIGRKKEALPASATALAAELGALRAQGTIDYGDVAILCRSSNAFPTYENALDAAGIPYVTVAGKGFYNRPEIRDLLNALTAIADPHDDLALVGLLRSPACDLSDESIYRLVRGRPRGDSLWTSLREAPPLPDTGEVARLADAVALIGDLNGQAGRTSVADLLKALLDRTHYRAILRQAGQERAVRNVSKLLRDVYSSELVSVGRFLEYAQTVRASGSREGEARSTGGGAVQIMSIHAAKGLEFPVVVLGDAARGSRPHSGVLIDPDLGILLPHKDEAKTKAGSYELAAARNKERETAEDKRLLYVALTRAEQLLILNGHCTQNKNSLGVDGWLKELSEIVPFLDCDLTTYDAEGAAAHHFELSLDGTAVGVSFYEPSSGPIAATPDAAATTAPPADLALLWPLDIADDRDRDDTPSRVWRVAPAGGVAHAPAWVIGKVVHEALALWRFADDDFDGDGFDGWATARAREFGLTDPGALAAVAARAQALLDRFRRQPLYHEMNTADRRLHEVPFSHAHDGLSPNGTIDALYERDGRWTIVDFKTDDLRGRAPAQVLAKSDYVTQVQRYGLATAALLGDMPRLMIYFLDAAAGDGLQVIAPARP